MIFENEKMNITSIYNVIYYQPKKIYHEFPGKLPTYELMYYTGGSAVVNFSGKELLMKKGDWLYLPKGLKENRYTLTIKEQPFSLYNIYFETDSKMPLYPLKLTAESIEYERKFEKLLRVWEEKKSGYYFKAMQNCYDIFLTASRIEQKLYSGKKKDYLEEVDEYIGKHYCDMNFNYEKLTMLSGLSYSYYKKLFIEKYGTSPVKYITNLKIKRACELLKTKKFTVTEVAEMCGFENVYYFSNVFKKEIGTAPTRY